MSDGVLRYMFILHEQQAEENKISLTTQPISGKIKLDAWHILFGAGSVTLPTPIQRLTARRQPIHSMRQKPRCY